MSLVAITKLAAGASIDDLTVLFKDWNRHLREAN
jgi:hypothetical protein